MKICVGAGFQISSTLVLYYFLPIPKFALFWTLALWREATRVLSRETKIKRAEKELAYHFVVFQIWTGHDPFSLSCINFFVRKRLNDFHPF